jgi:signal transduction histidine kinase
VRTGSPWSIERALQVRFLFAAILASVLVAGFVAFHYGRDLPELERRRTLLLTEKSISTFDGLDISAISSGARNGALDKVFSDHPDEYAWKVVDAQGHMLASSAFDWGNIESPNPAQLDEWYRDQLDVRRMAGKRFACGEADCWFVLSVTDSSIRYVAPLFVNEIAFHVGLPVLFVIAITAWFVTVVVRRTLQPLTQISKQAARVSSLHASGRVEVENSPEEVRDLVEALNDALEKLSAVVSRERDFLLDASHSLRTPLAALKARLDQSSGEIDLVRLRQETDAIIRLSSQLLAQAHSDRLSPSELRLCDLRPVCLDVVSRLEPIASRNGLDLGFEGASAPVMCNADSDAVAVALANLVENAMSFSPPGGVVTVKLDAATAQISVTDQGPGIDPERLAQLPKRFSTDGRSTRNGAGLGLSIAHQVMVTHGGELRLANRTDGGLQAALCFPILAAD